MAAPVGPTGCEGTPQRSGAWQLGGSYAFTHGDLRFDREDDYEIEQHAEVVTFGRRFGERFTLSLTAGAILDGKLEGQGSSYDIGPGFLASLTGAYRVLGGSGKNPFLTLTLGYGMSFTETHEIDGDREDEALMASDARLGALLGVTLFDSFSPYLAARAFGGPVSWQRRGEDRTGSDRHHYAIGIGSSFAVAPTLSLTIEAIPLGERTLGAGFSVSL